MPGPEELNPNHPVTRFAHDQWHKIALILMCKWGKDEVVITSEDLEAIASRPNGCNIAFISRNNVITLRLVDNDEAKRLAREELERG